MSAVPTTSPLQARRHRLRGRFGDLVLHGLTLAAALACLVLVGAIVWKIVELAGDSFDRFGLGFVTARAWDPVKHVFGALPFIYGTAVSSLVALIIATPLAIAIGLYLSELAPRGVRGIVGSLVELLAAIPSVVLGLWGILVLGPFLAHHVEPWLHSTLGFIPLFGDPQQTGQGLFTAAVILTIMIVPIVASISRELFLGVPSEGDSGDAGHRRWHPDRLVAVSARRHPCEQDRLQLPGCGLGPRNLLAALPCRDPARARSDRQPDRPGHRALFRSTSRSSMNRDRRRRLMNRAMEVIATVAALVAVAVLAIVVLSVARRGAGAVSWDFFTKPQALFGQPGGGIANALVGTALLVLLATAMALPVGVLTAIYLTEFAPRRLAIPIQVVIDVLAGLPTIVIGIFVYALLVIGHTQSGYAGAFALAVIMLPLIARATQEVLLLVPVTLREASLALGVRRWRTVVGVILPTSVGGILTGTVLAVARAAGETAPLLFTSSIFANSVQTDVTKALPNIPVLIFTYSEQPDPALHQQAWAAALVLMAFVLVASLLAKALLARSRRKLAR